MPRPANKLLHRTHHQRPSGTSPEALKTMSLPPVGSNRCGKVARSEHAHCREAIFHTSTLHNNVLRYKASVAQDYAKYYLIRLNQSPSRIRQPIKDRGTDY